MDLSQPRGEGAEVFILPHLPVIRAAVGWGEWGGSVLYPAMDSSNLRAAFLKGIRLLYN